MSILLLVFLWADFYLCVKTNITKTCYKYNPPKTQTSKQNCHLMSDTILHFFEPKRTLLCRNLYDVLNNQRNIRCKRSWHLPSSSPVVGKPHSVCRVCLFDEVHTSHSRTSLTHQINTPPSISFENKHHLWYRSHPRNNELTVSVGIV